MHTNWITEVKDLLLASISDGEDTTWVTDLPDFIFVALFLEEYTQEEAAEEIVECFRPEEKGF